MTLNSLASFLQEHERSTAERLRGGERYRALARLVRGYVFEARLWSTGKIEFTWADEEFRDIFGCEREEINRLGWQSFVDPRDRQSAYERLLHLSQGKQTEIELRVTSLTGEKRWLRMAAELLEASDSDDSYAIVGMAENITGRKTLMEHMFHLIHDEQRRIGHDLHDGLGQVLTGVSLLLSSCQTQVSRGEPVSSSDLDRLMELVNGAIETTRTLAHGLAPGTQEMGGLLSALNVLTNQFRQRGFSLTLTAHNSSALSLDSTVSDHLYRIVHEAVSNATRHAGASQVEIRYFESAAALVIEVVDDGNGIPDPPSWGFGMHSMRYRADAIGAKVSVDPIDPRGTRVQVRMPLRQYN